MSDVVDERMTRLLKHLKHPGKRKFFKLIVLTSRQFKDLNPLARSVGSTYLYLKDLKALGLIETRREEKSWITHHDGVESKLSMKVPVYHPTQLGLKVHRILLDLEKILSEEP